MKYRSLKKRGLTVSSMGLRTMGMNHAYGVPADKKEMKMLLAKAVDMGYTLFDTTECYVTTENPHDNEKLLGDALKNYHDKMVIATKLGIHFDTESEQVPYPLITDSHPDVIHRSGEGSLKRLQADHIDLYYQHRVDLKTSPEEVASAIANLIKEGKILHWGISEATEEVIRRAHTICPLTAVENRYSMMAPHDESLFPVLEELEIGFVAFYSLANGLLSNKYTASYKFEAGTDYRASMLQFKPESFAKNRELLELIRRFAEEKQATAAQISLVWMLRKKPWIVPIPETRKLNRLQENRGAANINLTINEISQIDNALDTMQMSTLFGGTKIKE